jgi:PAS domain S-box-containing protein
MSDNQKSKAELISEAAKLRREISKLKTQLSKLKSKEKEGEDRNELLRMLIDALPDPMYIKDTASRKILANLADVRNLGCQTESQVIGKDDFAFFPKEIADKFFADDQYVIKNCIPVINREEFFYDSIGQQRWLLTNKLPMFDDNGVVTGIVGVGRDITKLKVAELDLQKYKDSNPTVIK